MAVQEKTIRLSVDIQALKLIDTEIRKRGMTRSEFMVRAALAFTGASPFTEAEERAIRAIVTEMTGATS